MSKNARPFKMLIAGLLIVIGAIGMIFAWFILLTTNTHNLAVVALEIGGVAVCLAGYFIRKRIRLPEKDVKSKDCSKQFGK